MLIVAAAFVATHLALLGGAVAVLALGLWRVGGAGRLGRWLLGSALVGYPMAWGVFTAANWDKTAPAIQNALDGLLTSGQFALRLLAIILANLIVVATTDPRQFARSLRGWRAPPELCLMLMTVLRFLPLAAGQARRILDAQRCRGFRLRRLWRPGAWLPLGVPLLVATLYRAEALAMSLELRGFAGGLAALAPADRWRLREYGFVAACIAGCGAMALVR
jgi:energy-coupling factor transporter transmembrane protein EcfT